MPIQATCPKCDAGYTLRDEMAGKTVRCKKCQANFLVRNSAGGADDILDITARDAIQSEKRQAKAAPAGGDDEARAHPRKRDEDDRDDFDDRDAPPPPKKKSSAGLVFGILAIVGAVLLLCCGVPGGAFFYITYKAKQAVEELAENGPLDDAGNPIFINAREPKDLNDAIDALRSNERGRRIGAANWLARQPVDPGRRAEVARGLDRMLTDTDGSGRGPALAALKTWADRDSVPALVNVLKDESFGLAPNANRDAAMDVAANLKDVRLAPHVAKYLANAFHNEKAKHTLQAMGPGMEAEVAKFLFHPDGGARERAASLLQIYNTKTDVAVTAAVAELRSPDVERRRLAADWLAKQPPLPDRRRAVTTALEPLVTGADQRARDPALRALVAWAGQDNVPTLIAVLNENNGPMKPELMAALARIGDDRAAAAVAGQLPNFFVRGQAKAALRTMGPKAEKEVAKLLFHGDQGVRRDADELLRGYGTRPEVILGAAREALKDPRAELRREAANWLATTPAVEEQRAEVAAGLEAILNDEDRETCRAAVKAMARWGTKDNVVSLLGIVNEPSTHRYANELRGDAIKALGGIKDERAVLPLAKHLTNIFVGRQAQDALVAMGPAAEKPLVMLLLGANDERMIVKICEVLSAVGTQKGSVPALLKVFQVGRALKKQNVMQAATFAVQAINARDPLPDPKKKDPPKKDGDRPKS
ncbi:MAG TPA: hypothetical protein VFA26_15320 [Gemmataceae bacterium]|nr:hypothetical protein [Gemmataceae bacterium]